MLEQKQIEQMSEDIASMLCEAYTPNCDEYRPHNCSHCYLNSTPIGCFVEDLYNAGYRKQEWISVKDRLPKQWEMVLVSCDDIISTDFISSHGRWYEHIDHDSVTHWMPLPEPPKMKGGAE